MHMADALVSPVVGTTFWAASAGTIAYCSARVRKGLDDRKVPFMGVLGAFIFAAQMISFTIPATGSSGHLGGGLLLAILLGPSAAFLTIASVLMVQALFFADGGLLALGCNIFNLGVLPAFIAYPFFFQRLVGDDHRQARMVLAAIAAAVVALQLGSLGVVLQTATSGVSALPLGTFLLLMQPIHLVIGFVEGVVTALVVSFIYRTRPEILESTAQDKPLGNLSMRLPLVTLATAAILAGSLFSLFASEHPDGLEWSVAKIVGTYELPAATDKGHRRLASLQEKTALLPDYNLPSAARADQAVSPVAQRAGTSLSGLVGGAITLVVCLVIGILLKWRTQEQRTEANHG